MIYVTASGDGDIVVAAVEASYLEAPVLYKGSGTIQLLGAPGLSVKSAPCPNLPCASA